MPTEAALEATVATQPGIQHERLDYDDHESMSSKSAAELAASAAQLRRLMQQLLDSRSPRQQRLQLLPELQPPPQGPSLPDQQHQTYQVHPDVVLSEQHRQQGLQGQESMKSFGSSFSLQTRNSVAVTVTAIQAPPETSLAQTTSAVTEPGSVPAQINPAPEVAPMAPVEQVNTTHNGLHSLADHARDLLQEIEAAAASSPATTIVSCVHSPAQQQQQCQGREVHAQEVPRRQLPFTQQQDNPSAAGSSPAGHATVAAASSLDESLTWSTALQQYQLHTQQQQEQLQIQLQQQQQQQQQQPHVTDEHHADNWSSSYLANSPSPDGFGGLYPPYSAAMSAAPAAPLTVEQSTAMQLEPCAAAVIAAPAPAVAARIAAVNSSRSAAQSALPPDHCWVQQLNKQCYNGAIQKTAAMSMVLDDSVSVSVPGAAAAAAGSAHGSSVFGGCDAKGAAAAAADQLDPGLRLRVRSLRGPLEDAMRCYAELHEVKEETSLLRATNARLTAAAQDTDSEKTYLLAERALLISQLQNMATLLAADERVGAGGSSGDAAAAAVRLSSAGRPSGNSAGGAPRAPDFLGTYSAGDSTSASTLIAESEAKAQLETAWRLLAPNSPLRFTCHPSQIPHDISTVVHKFQAAIERRQQLVLQLHQQLGQQAVALQQAQQAAEVLQQRLAAAGNAAQLTVGQIALKLEAKWGKRVIKAEQKVAMLAHEHQSAVAELQQQLRQSEHALAEAQQTAEQHADDKARLAGRLAALETENEALQEQLEGHKAAKRTAEEQVASLQQEQQQLLAALSALEGSLLEARQSTEVQRAAAARLEDALQRKNIAAVEVKQQLREARQQAQQASTEVQQLQQQLGALRNKVADTARQLSAARTSAKEASEALAAEQARAQHQTAVMEEVRAELHKARRASAAAQKAQATEAKHAAAAEATITCLRQELSAVKEAAADATAAAEAAETKQQKAQQQKQQAQQEVQQLQHQVEQLSQTNQRITQQRQQLQHQLSEYEDLLVEYKRSLAAAVQRADSADAELAGIRQEVADWASLRNLESFELQETRQKLAAAETDLGVALQRVAACGMQTRLGAGSRPASAGTAGRATAPAERRAGRLGAGNSCLDSENGSPVAAGGSVVQQQQQHLPVEVTRQLQWQAEEVLRLTGQLHQLQAQLKNYEQQLSACPQQLANTQQQLAAAEDAVRWQQQQQQRASALHPQDDSAKVQAQQQKLQQLQHALAETEVRVAELTSALAAAKSELVQQQREHHLQVRKMQEDLAAAEAAAAEAQQQLQDQQWQQQDQQQQLVMDRLQQLQQLEAEGLLLRQAQVSSSSSEDDSSSASDMGSDCHCSHGGSASVAAAAAELAAHKQHVSTQLRMKQKQQQQQQQQQQDQHTGERVSQEVFNRGSQQAKSAACPAAVVAKNLAEAAAASVAEAQGASHDSSSINDTGQASSRCAAAGAHSCSIVADAVQLQQAAACTVDIGAAEGSSSSSSSSSRCGRKVSGSSSSSRKSRGTCRPVRQGLNCTTNAAVGIAAAPSGSADGHAALRPNSHVQQKQQQGGLHEWEQQLQQQELQVEQQLLKQQPQWQTAEQQPSYLLQKSLGSPGVQKSYASAVGRQSWHAIPSGSGACTSVISNSQATCNAMHAAAVPASVGLGSTAQQPQQQLLSETAPLSGCEAVAADTSSQLWEVASSSCDYEGALAAAAAALQAAS